MRIRESRVLNTRGALILAACMIACPAMSVSPSDEAPMDEFSELNAWMDQLHFPAPDGKRFCRLTHMFPGCTKPELMYGIVVAEMLDSTVVFTDDARVAVVIHDDMHSVDIEFVSFREYLDRIMNSQDSFSNVENPGYCWEVGLPIGAGIKSLSLHAAMRDIIVAKWCATLGHNNEAAHLWARGYGSMPRLVLDAGPIDQFRHGLCSILTERAIASMANPRMSRSECCARLEWIIRICPQGEFAQVAKDRRDELAEALKLEAELRESNRKGPASLDDLIKQLIDQRCDGGDLRSGLMPIEPFGHNSAWVEIVRVGKAALPKLREYSNSTVPSRCVVNERFGIPVVRWVSVGELATFLIDCIEESAEKDQ